MNEVALCQCGCGLPAPVPKWNDAHQGWVRGVPRPFRVGHNRRPKADTKTLAERLWQRVAVGGPDECWPWTAKTTCAGGYGKLYSGQTIIRAHRFAYELAKGPIPQGLIVRHICDNPPCCNPGHLVVGTMKENTQDMMRRGRSKKGRFLRSECLRGHTFTDETTGRDSKGYRFCKICRLDNERRKRAAKRLPKQAGEQ